MFTTQDVFHELKLNDESEAPQQFTFPFNYTPHPWVEKAADELKAYLESQKDFEYNFGWDDKSVGKMFGVLIVEDEASKLGYLAAFSGKITEVNELDGFVPPVYDILNPQGFFKIGERELDDINLKIADLASSNEYIRLKKDLRKTLERQKSILTELKTKHKTSKKLRDHKRSEILKLENKDQQQELLNQLIEESKRNHFELKDQKRIWNEKLSTAQAKFEEFKEKIISLKKLRKEKSAELQARIHKAYNLLNAKGEVKSLLPIFEPFNRIPPAGAGECAAPRLLQHAFQHNMKPIAMGEFWWGKAPQAEIRKHGEFYPACKAKCEPILSFMLDGLEVEDNPIFDEVEYDLEVIFEDEYLMLVNKPAGVLSVPGKEIKDCLWQKVVNYLGSNYSPLLVHRLDMATSGIVLVAKNMDVYKILQKQFTERSVNKTYTAILDGELNQDRGKIDLPLRVDLDNRPMQLVCHEHGKQAITHYQAIDKNNSKTRILFYPITGRTHQLRVHAAHNRGLGIPIMGDDLYGRSKDRLYLHATDLEFNHPVSGERLKFTKKAPF